MKRVLTKDLRSLEPTTTKNELGAKARTHFQLACCGTCSSKLRLAAPYSPHSFRATGITNFLENDGALEAAQRIIGHVDAVTQQTAAPSIRLRHLPPSDHSVLRIQI
jgi:integrase